MVLKKVLSYLQNYLPDYVSRGIALPKTLRFENTRPCRKLLCKDLLPSLLMLVEG
jgi:hypothetical protein